MAPFWSFFNNKIHSLDNEKMVYNKEHDLNAKSQYRNQNTLD